MRRSKKAERIQQVGVFKERFVETPSEVVQERLDRGLLVKEAAIAAREVITARASQASVMDPDAVEQALVSAFVVSTRRPRWSDALANPKVRGKILARLDHNV